MTTRFLERFNEPIFGRLSHRKKSIHPRLMKLLNSINLNIANADSARRFWSIFQYAFTRVGVLNMYKPKPQWGSKYFNPFNDLIPWWRYDYEPLRKYLSKFVDFPIKTSFDKDEPILLLTIVDVQDYTIPIVFDSYEKLHEVTDSNDNTIKSGNGNSNDSQYYIPEYGDEENKHIVFYDGIEVDQELASALG